MKCAACGYSDDKADDYREDIKVAPGNMPLHGSKPFVEITPGSSSFWVVNGGFLRAFACPICGTVKMEV